MQQPPEFLTFALDLLESILSLRVSQLRQSRPCPSSVQTSPTSLGVEPTTLPWPLLPRDVSDLTSLGSVLSSFVSSHSYFISRLLVFEWSRHVPTLGASHICSCPEHSSLGQSHGPSLASFSRHHRHLLSESYTDRITHSDSAPTSASPTPLKNKNALCIVIFSNLNKL